MKYFDVHSHLQEKEFDNDRGEVLGRMEREKVASIIIGTDYESSLRAVQLVKGYDFLYATVGLHPTDNAGEKFDPLKYSELIKKYSESVVGIGECGLEYFYLKGKDIDGSEKKRQKELFKSQVEFADFHTLPLMLHCRPSDGTMDSYLDVLDILEGYKKEYGDNLRGNVHFFAGDSVIASRFLDLGFTLSFTGVITFVSDYDDVIKSTPIDRILSETDSPYVAPVPYRGSRNEPVYVKEIVERIAEIKGEDLEKIRRQLVSNAKKCFL